MKVDFIHIGLQKTASTFLQSKVFPGVENLVVLNHKDHVADQWFYDRFIHADAHAFNKASFLNGFSTLASGYGADSADRHVYAISEESLSGDIYTGLESRELMLRLHDIFGSTKILIVIRNQIDFILSAYSNYVLHGGTKSIAQWLFGQETRFGRILNKVMYSALIKGYKALFGDDQVFVIQYEKLFDNTEGIVPFLSRFGLTVPIAKNERINPGRSLRGNSLLATLNRFGLGHMRGRQIILGLFKGSGSDRKYLQSLLQNQMSNIYADSRETEKVLGTHLVREYFE